MYNILKLNSISPLVNEIFDKNYAVSDNCTDADAIIVRSFNMHDYPVSKSVLAVARAGAGYNNIPFDDYAKKGIVVFNTPGANANAVKELVIASMFIAARNLKSAMLWADGLKGDPSAASAVEKGKSQFVGPEIMGKTIGLIGLGAIGRMVADGAIALGMKVVGYDPYLSSELVELLKGKVTIVDSLEKMYPLCDFISLHMPLTAETSGMINKDSISKMKDGVIVINCARAKLVDTASIKDALSAKKVTAYVTDFPDADTIGTDGIICVPHLGASTPEAEDNCAIMAAKQIKDFLENGNIKNSVNIPNLKKDRTKSKRLSIISTAPVSDKLGLKDAEIKFVSNGEYFYTIADFDGDVDTIWIEAIPEVIRARLV